MPVKPHPPKVSAFTRRVSWFVGTRPGSWFFKNVAMRVDRLLMPATRGRLRMSLSMPSALLTHKGAKSGVERTTPMLYFTDGDDVILVGSNGGAPNHPAWLHNLRAHSGVRAVDRRSPGALPAREAEGAERERLWTDAVGMYPGFDVYRHRAGSRQIPVVVCTPV